MAPGRMLWSREHIMHGYFFGDPAGLVFEPSRWHRLLYDARFNAGPTLLTTCEEEIATALLDDHFDHEGAELEDDDVIDEETEAITTGAHTFCTEVYSRIYNAPKRLESDPPAWARLAHEALEEVGGWEALCRSVESDPDMAAMATGVMLREIAPRIPELLESLREELKESESDDGDQDGQGREDGKGDAAGAGAGEDGDQAGEGQETPQPAGESDGTQDTKAALRAALTRAVREASDDVAEARTALAGLLPGLEAAPPMQEQPKTDRMELIEKLREDRRLLQVLRIAGKIERIAHRVRMVRCDDIPEEVVGIERGGDIARILPSELVGLVSGDDDLGQLLELQTLAKIAERKALQYKVSGEEPLGRGPMVVLLDESGSMGGEWRVPASRSKGLRPIDWAKAVALASLHTALREHRPLSLAGFDTRVRGTLRVEASGECSSGWGSDYAGQTTKWTPLDGPQAAAWNILSRAPAGGTNFSRALKWGLANGALDDRADIVIVTDGQAQISGEMLAELREAKETREVRVFGITLNGGAVGAVMLELCDDIVDLDQVDDLSKAIGGMGVH